jgi:serine/threonine protein kinase
MANQVNSALPDGFRIEEYTIVRQLSAGGFSIVYLAHDAKGQDVAIKEYLPNRLALRSAGEIRPVIQPDNLGAFRYGLKCFFEEGKALSRLSHPNVMRVSNFFYANETVYMVMDYKRGRTLREFVRKHQGHISERFLRGTFSRLLDGLGVVHSNKLLHLDLKPSNIYLYADNTPILIDFGAARQTLQANTPILKPMYTPGFASPEHYGSRENLGPWSDIYSVGASIYACLGGQTPQAADERQKEDLLQKAAIRWKDRFSAHFLETVDSCLELEHENRPQSAYSLQKMLNDDDAMLETMAEMEAPPHSKGWFGKIPRKFAKFTFRK